MKKVLLFILLKVVEIGSIVFIPYYNGKFLLIVFPFLTELIEEPTQIICTWGIGILAVLAFTLVPFLVKELGGELYRVNMELVNKILGDD